ncbi:MAG: hypothetical protein JRJ54_14835 [Deltaproteobacteria bacterium]|nr:hypothetical protein [Deltaproteobacteria bacterium]
MIAAIAEKHITSIWPSDVKKKIPLKIGKTKIENKSSIFESDSLMSDPLVPAFGLSGSMNKFTEPLPVRKWPFMIRSLLHSLYPVDRGRQGDFITRLHQTSIGIN